MRRIQKGDWYWVVIAAMSFILAILVIAWLIHIAINGSPGLTDISMGIGMLTFFTGLGVYSMVKLYVRRGSMAAPLILMLTGIIATIFMFINLIDQMPSGNSDAGFTAFVPLWSFVTVFGFIPFFIGLGQIIKGRQ